MTHCKSTSIKEYFDEIYIYTCIICRCDLAHGPTILNPNDYSTYYEMEQQITSNGTAINALGVLGFVLT